jgi:hypothetical protein
MEIRDSNNTSYHITKEGSLSLLAIGYKGVMLWRKKRFEDERTLSQK